MYAIRISMGGRFFYLSGSSWAGNFEATKTKANRYGRDQALDLVRRRYPLAIIVPA